MLGYHGYYGILHPLGIKVRHYDNKAQEDIRLHTLGIKDRHQCK